MRKGLKWRNISVYFIEKMIELVCCTCKLNLGYYEVSIQDINDSVKIERKCKLVNKAIYYLGPSNSQEN